MKKRITFTIETESENDRIKFYLESWIKDNFKFPESDIKIEDIDD